MGYIDIWGFIEDNSDNLDEEIGYMDAGGTYREHTLKSAALSTENKITSLPRYLPPMHAIVLKLKEGKAAATTLDVILNTSRIVTDVVVTPPTPAPKRTHAGAIINKGIMTVTAVNPVDEIFTELPQSQRQFQDGRPGLISSALLSTTNIPKRRPVRSFILLMDTCASYDILIFPSSLVKDSCFFCTVASA
jgi:hypothetical protein